MKVMYNFSVSSWTNVSAASYSYYGYAESGVAHFVPSYGPDGLLVILGGYNAGRAQFASLEYVALFDPTTQQWQTQVATGDVPDSFVNACVVGVQGDEDTYEVRDHYFILLESR